MSIALGIDTGGTYTDAVLVDHGSGAVLASAKALTTHHDLSIGIGQAVSAVLKENTAPINLVALSTTLATNAIVEGRGSPVCLLLIGYSPALIRQYGFERELVAQNVVYLRGGHDGLGNEQEPLDEVGVREAILAHRDRVEAFAVSGYFGVRNPAHELRVRALIEGLTDLPVTCGHELTSRLNAVRRATTVALNARLIPLLRELIATVRSTLNALGVTAPLMVVRGDGSLVRVEWAMRRPIETILSGPAASVLGAWHLGGRRDAWVVDVGGTTTDIAVLRDGRPRLNPEGAQVGGWRTMIEAVDVHTVGLGGDSLVSLDTDHQVVIGPRRVVPLCMLASQYPEIVDELRQLRVGYRPQGEQFVMAYRSTAPSLSEEDEQILAELMEGPCSLQNLLGRLRYGMLVMRRIEALEARRLVQRAGFTPTDALHVLGRLGLWDAEASRLAAQVLARQLGLSPESFCERVVLGVSDRIVTEVVGKALGDEGVAPDWKQEKAAAALLERALGHSAESGLSCRLALRDPIMAIGAPAEAYLPRVAQQLDTGVIVPVHAGVANAVGAAIGSVMQQVRVMLRPLNGNQAFRLHLPDGVQDVPSVEEGLVHAERVVRPWLEEMARRAGAEQIEIQMVRVDHNASVATGWGEQLYLGTDLILTAVGRPSPARTPE